MSTPDPSSAPLSAPPPRPAARQPWPMRWIVLTILVVIVPYTYVNLKFRKPNKAFEPYADMLAQANVDRLLQAGFRRISLPFEVNSAASVPSPAASAALLAPAPGGLPAALGEVLIEPPRLPVSYREVVAPAESAESAPLRLRFALEADDAKLRLASVDVYLRDQTAVIVPALSSSGTPDRDVSAVREVSLPAGVLTPGTHVFTLAGARDSVSWSVLVR